MEEDDPDKGQKSKSKGALHFCQVLLRVRVRVRVQLLFFVPAPFSFYFTARVWIVLCSPAYMHTLPDTLPAYMFLLLSFLLCRSPKVCNQPGRHQNCQTCSCPRKRYFAPMCFKRTVIQRMVALQCIDVKMEFGQTRTIDEDILKDRITQLTQNPPAALLRLVVHHEVGVFL